MRIPTLDLKIIAHHGLIAEQRMAGRAELVGRDVIVVHRLLKNDIEATLGIAAYAAYTDACLAAMGVDDPAAIGLREHTETYDAIGEVRIVGQRPGRGVAPAPGADRGGHRRGAHGLVARRRGPAAHPVSCGAS